MTRRIFAVATVTAALALAPAAAFAYEAEAFDSTVTTGDNSVAYFVNGPQYNTIINVTVNSVPTTIDDSAITIAGTASLSKATDANGDASFAITVTEEATYNIVATDSEGDIIDQQSFEATWVDGTTGGTTGGTTTTAATGTGTLPVTGSSVLPLALGAGALAAAGAGAVVVANKRREGSQS